MSTMPQQLQWQVVPLHEIKKKLKGSATPLLVRVSHKTNVDVVA
jgi:hypothetical protein